MSGDMNMWALLVVPVLIVCYVIGLRWATTPDRETRELAAKPPTPVDRPVEGIVQSG